MCLRLSCGSQTPPPATTYRRDSPEVAKLCHMLIAETDARSAGDSHPSCMTLSITCKSRITCKSNEVKVLKIAQNFIRYK